MKMRSRPLWGFLILALATTGFADKGRSPLELVGMFFEDNVEQAQDQSKSQGGAVIPQEIVLVAKRPDNVEPEIMNFSVEYQWTRDLQSYSDPLEVSRSSIIVGEDSINIYTGRFKESSREFYNHAYILWK